MGRSGGKQEACVGVGGGVCGTRMQRTRLPVLAAYIACKLRGDVMSCVLLSDRIGRDIGPQGTLTAQEQVPL